MDFDRDGPSDQGASSMISDCIDPGSRCNKARVMGSEKRRGPALPGLR